MGILSTVTSDQLSDVHVQFALYPLGRKAAAAVAREVGIDQWAKAYLHHTGLDSALQLLDGILSRPPFNHALVNDIQIVFVMLSWRPPESISLQRGQGSLAKLIHEKMERTATRGILRFVLRYCLRCVSQNDSGILTASFMAGSGDRLPTSLRPEQRSGLMTDSQVSKATGRWRGQLEGPALYIMISERPADAMFLV